MEIKRNILKGGRSIIVSSGYAVVNIYEMPGQPMEFGWLFPGSPPLQRSDPMDEFPPPTIEDTEGFIALLSKAVEIARRWEQEPDYCNAFPEDETGPFWRTRKK